MGNSIVEMGYKKAQPENNRRKAFFNMLKKDIIKNKYVYIMAIPVVVYYIIFDYWPMYGVQIAFKDFNPTEGIMGGDWVGFKHFLSFFNGHYFGRVVRNTLIINLYDLIWGFPAPIALALLLNEVYNKSFKKLIQTVIYMPHFISGIVVAGIIISFSARNGFINDIIEMFGGTRANLLMRPELFRTIYTGSKIWQGVGWGTIVYLAALSGVDVQLYEACIIDGGNRWKQMAHITLPSIMPTIVTLLILNIGKLMSEGAGRIILIYNPLTYETADIISSYVYRRGLQEFDYSFSTAVNLLSTVLNFLLLISANWMSRKVNETSLW